MTTPRYAIDYALSYDSRDGGEGFHFYVVDFRCETACDVLARFPDEKEAEAYCSRLNAGSIPL